MLRSMFAAVSGLQAHQTFMDVVGNNIANVNTTGFKAGTVEFEDLLSQTHQRRGRAAPAICRWHQPGAGRPRCAARGHRHQLLAGCRAGDRPGDRLRDPGRRLLRRASRAASQAYTRNGSFSLDGLGQLVTGDGGLVQGWQADPQGNVNTNASTGPVKIPVGQTIAAGHDREHQHRRQPAVRLRGRHDDRRLDRREQQPRRVDAAAHGVHEGRRHRRAASTGR